jgi:5-formyltetrahydrofolate cyclo-ligase
MSLSTKEHFRKLFLEKLKFFSKHSKIKKDKYICTKILQIIDLHKAKNILLYIPLESEVDVRPLINVLRKRRDTKVYVPFMEGDSFIPVEFRYPLRKKRFGIQEPPYSKCYKKKIDAAVVPIVGIDPSLRRVGFGAGMYDRFYDRLGYRPVTIFTQLKLCVSDTLITSSYDIEPDYIITT